MTEGKHPGGRPTKYDPIFCQQIIEYFSVPPTNIIYRTEYNKDGSVKCEVPVITAAELPTYQGFAHSIDVHIDTLIEWTKIHPKFSESYARAKQLQEQIWLVNSLENRYNAQFAMFFGKNCLGYKDKSETELTGPGGGPIQAVSLNNLSLEELEGLERLALKASTNE